jgi:hypothetical protein
MRAGERRARREVCAMKSANVIEVRDVVSTGSADMKLGDRAKRQRIEELLRKWPDTKEAETAEIRHFLATGSHLDVGLVSGSDELRETVQRFRSANHQHFRLKGREVFTFLLVTLGPIGAMFWRYLG